MSLAMKSKSLLLTAGAILMVVGVVAFVLMWHREVACWVFLAGTVLFAVMQAMQPYEEKSLSVRRLKNIQNLAGLLLLLSGILMVDTVYHFLLPVFGDNGQAYYNYIEYVYNKWVILLLIAGILEVYSTLRIGTEIGREKQEEGSGKTKKS